MPIFETVEKIVAIGRAPGSLRRRYRTAGCAITRYAEARRAWHELHSSMPVGLSLDLDMRQLEQAIVRRLVDFDGTPGDRAAELLDHIVENFPDQVR